MVEYRYDLVLRGGRLIDPTQNLNGLFDVGFKDGRVKDVRSSLDPHAARNSIDMKGYLVTPGLIDLHTHVFHDATPLGIHADLLSLHSGVTTFVDAGSTGAGSFAGFNAFVMAPSRSRILAFININYAGIFGVGNEINVGENLDLRLLDANSAVRVAREHPDRIVGIKVRASYSAGNPSLEPVYAARAAADQIARPMMVHMGQPPPYVEAVLPLLRSGDIITHIYKGFPNRIVNGAGRVIGEALEARERGVFFDVGHGKGGFAYQVARAALSHGFYPDTISSDVHMNNIDGPVYDLPTTLSKFLALGMPLVEVIAAATINPAKAIGWQDRIGTLKPGAVGDATVMELRNGPVDLFDTAGDKITAGQTLRAVGMVIAGEFLKTSLQQSEEEDRKNAY